MPVAQHPRMPAPTARADYRAKRLSAVPSDIEQHIKALDLSDNELKTLALPHLVAVEELLLARNALTAKAVQESALPATLRILDLTENLLVALPPQVMQLQHLQVLRVARQRLKILPADLTMMRSLVELDVSYNEVQQALFLKPQGLPSLRRLSLRGNRLSKIKMREADVPSLTELDLSDNEFVHWPGELDPLPNLRRISFENNRLKSLVSESVVAHRRMWVPASGAHTLPALAELCVARNELREAPHSLQLLDSLRLVDMRCNPLKPTALAALRVHCEATGARLLSSELTEVIPGVLMGEPSGAWHRPTLFYHHVTAVLSVSTPPPSVAMKRIFERHQTELATLGLAGSSTALLSPASLRRAFLAAALRVHPDKVAPEERAAAAERFAAVQAAFCVVSRALQSELRRLPEFERIEYSYVDFAQALWEGANSSRASTGASYTGAAGTNGCAAAVGIGSDAAGTISSEVASANGCEVAAANRTEAAGCNGIGPADTLVFAEGIRTKADLEFATSAATTATATSAATATATVAATAAGAAVATAAAVTARHAALTYSDVEGLIESLVVHLREAADFIKAATERGGRLLLHTGVLPPWRARVAASTVLLALAIANGAPSLRTAARMLGKADAVALEEMPSILQETLRRFAAAALQRHLVVERDADADVAVSMNLPHSLHSTLSRTFQSVNGSGESFAALSSTVGGEFDATDGGALPDGWTLNAQGQEVLHKSGGGRSMVVVVERDRDARLPHSNGSARTFIG